MQMVLHCSNLENKLDKYTFILRSPAPNKEPSFNKETGKSTMNSSKS